MASVARDRIRIEQHSIGGLLWLGGWLFTTGFLQLTLGRALLAVVAWPYFIGVAVSSWIK